MTDEIITNKKTNYWKIFGIVVILIAIGIRLYVGYSYQENSSYNEGFKDGQLYTVDIITRTGQIPFFSNYTGNTTIEFTNSTSIISGYLDILKDKGYQIVKA